MDAIFVKQRMFESGDRFWLFSQTNCLDKTHLPQRGEAPKQKVIPLIWNQTLTSHEGRSPPNKNHSTSILELKPKSHFPWGGEAP